MLLRPRLVLLIAAFLSLALTPASAAEVLDVEASAFFPVVVAGGFGEVSCTVRNRSDSDLRVFIEGHVRYEGTGRSRMLGPSILEIPSGLSVEILPLFLVPETADPGPATFTCRAHVAGPLPRDDRHDIEPESRRDEATAAFLVAE